MWIALILTVVVISSGALIAAAAVAWEERRRVPAVVPMCARCGYDLVGLESHKACPECNAAGERAYRPIAECPRRARVLGLAWRVPLCGAVVPVVLLGVLGGGPAQWAPASGAMLGTFVLLAVALSVLVRWITPRAGMVMLIGASAVVTLGAIGLIVGVWLLGRAGAGAALGLAGGVALADAGPLSILLLPLMSVGVVPGVVMSVRTKWGDDRPSAAPSSSNVSHEDRPARKWRLDPGGRVHHE